VKSSIGAGLLGMAMLAGSVGADESREFNGAYRGDYLNRVAFPVGGMGAGMFAVEGSGSFAQMQVRHAPALFNSPNMFAAIHVKGAKNGTKVLEGQPSRWKLFGNGGTGNGYGPIGYPRFEEAVFNTRFPFADIELVDDDIPLEVGLVAWSPFTPFDPDHSSLPVGAVEYTFKNSSDEQVEAVFSFHAENFMKVGSVGGDAIHAMEKGFVLSQSGEPKHANHQGDFAVFTDEPAVIVDAAWYRGGWSDSRLALWNDIEQGNLPSRPEAAKAAGGSFYVPFKLAPGESKTVKVLMSWFVPYSDLNVTTLMVPDSVSEVVLPEGGDEGGVADISDKFHQPWYSAKFGSVIEVADYWRAHYDELYEASALFAKTFYASELPPEVIEAVAANLAILKTPTVLRQRDGRLWGWEGCSDFVGSCPGSCNHVWNYAQALSRLFPSLERSLRQTEFGENQNEHGSQCARAYLPIREIPYGTPLADGQLGGIIKIYRDWRISGDTDWMLGLWPKIKASMEFCIRHWDPRHTGALEEPQHNTHDVQFWGPNGMNQSMYLGALEAAIRMGETAKADISVYEELLGKGRKIMENDLYDGEYFIQKVKVEGLDRGRELHEMTSGWVPEITPEVEAVIKAEGPMYQYGSGCLSDGQFGFWMARMANLGGLVDAEKERSHLDAVYRYNFRKDLADFSNPQRPTYAYGKEGGLIICTWPKGGMPLAPVIHSHEVWTGIEYSVASHLMMMGEVEKGLEIVRAVRARHDGRVRNPFDEYEAGHWYARAMASYGLIQGLTGIFYDAVDQTMYIDSQIGNNFKSFFASTGGYGLVGLENGKPVIEVVQGEIPVKRFIVSGKEFER